MPIQYIPTKSLDNLFSANHRQAMIAKYDYTDALTMTVDDALFEARMNSVIRPEIQDHDCSLSPMDSCKGCEEIQAALEDLK